MCNIYRKKTLQHLELKFYVTLLLFITQRAYKVKHKQASKYTVIQCKY